MKTIAYELHEDLGDEPGCIIAPTSSGTLILGLYTGFRELKHLGLVGEIPRLFAAQARGFEHVYSKLYGKPLSSEKSRLADALRVEKPPRLSEIVRAIVETGGGAVAVGDVEIVEGLKMAYRNGLAIEPSSATAIAAYRKLVEEGLVGRDETTVLILTGSGRKMGQLALT